MWEKLKGHKYLIAVSGGPDSMALLDMCVKKGIECVVAHVNYNKRDTAVRDQKIVEQYCLKNHIICEVLFPKNASGNFQTWARDVRYAFFHDLIEKYALEGCLIAHQLDDLLETYLMQKSKNILPDHYGIKAEIMLKGVKIIRPLLNYTKAELEQYCLTNEVAYGIDESNLTLAYSRNKVRHLELANYDRQQKIALLAIIEEKNLELARAKKKIKIYVDLEEIQFCEFEKMLELEQCLLIREWINKYLQQNFSQNRCLEYVKQLLNAENLEINVNNCVKLSKMYQNIGISEIKDVSYCYTFENIKNFKCDYFQLVSNGKKIEGVTLYPNDFPITIRNYQIGDKIALKFGHKKLNRFFIDKKIPYDQRQSWPVMVNKDQKVIFVSGIGADLEHYSNNPTIFMIK